MEVIGREHATVDAGVVVLARPPIVYAVSILLGVGLNFLWPVEVVPHVIEQLGKLLILVAVGLFALSIRELQRAATTFRTRRPTTVLVRTGPYRLSRNPMYLAFTLLHLGVGIWLNSVWVLAMLVPSLALVSGGVIAREERYLLAKFREEYRRYQAAVRRWT